MELTDQALMQILEALRATPEFAWARGKMNAAQKAKAAPAKLPDEVRQFSAGVLADSAIRYAADMSRQGKYVSFDNAVAAVRSAGPGSNIRRAAEAAQGVVNLESRQAALNSRLDQFEAKLGDRLTERVVKYCRDRQRAGKYISFDEARAIVSKQA